jgi:hypothetical protein
MVSPALPHFFGFQIYSVGFHNPAFFLLKKSKATSLFMHDPTDGGIIAHSRF